MASRAANRLMRLQQARAGAQAKATDSPYTPYTLASRHKWLALLICALALLLAACGGSSAALQPTPSPTAKPSFVYVALGASDAVGIGADDPNTQGYVPRLISRLPKTAYPLNLGVSGIHLRAALSQELPDALKAQPNLVTIWLVGNDFRDCVPLDQYAADLDRLLSQLQTQTQAQIFVGNVPDMSLLPYFQQGARGGGACVAGASTAKVRQLAQQWNATIDPIIQQHRAVLVNLFDSDLAAHPDYISAQDGFHPSSAGYARLADLFWQQITAHHAVPNSG